MKLALDEKIQKNYRQTKVLLVGHFLFSAILLYLPLNFLSKYNLSENLGRLPLLWSILVALYFLNYALLWWVNFVLVTNKRLLIIRYHSLLHKQVTDVPKDKIVNISYEKRGLWPALFNYGNVIVQQQNLGQGFVLSHLADPAGKKEEISELIK